MSSLPVPPPALESLPNVNSVLGPPFVGMVVSALLFGVSILQMYIYYQKFPEDWVIYRVSVVVLWLLDALNLAVTVHCVYYYLIYNFGNYLAMADVVWSFKLRAAIDVTIIIIVHSLYCLRLWKLNYRKTLLPQLLPILVTFGTGLGIVLVVETYKMRVFEDLVHMQWAITSAMIFAGVVDFMIAAAMCYYLYGSRSDFSATNSKISRLILWTLSTGLVTSITTLVAVILSMTLSGSLVFLAFDFVLTKIYFNSLLAMLNARKGTYQGPNDGSYAINIPHPPNRSLESGTMATPMQSLNKSEGENKFPAEPMIVLKVGGGPL